MKNKIIYIFSLVFLISVAAVARDYPHGSYPHGSYPHGSYPHGSYPHGSYPHGSYPHGSYPHGSYPHGSYPHGSYPHGSYPHGSYPHGSYPHGSYPQGKHDNFSGCLIETGVAIECPEGTYKYIGQSPLSKINGAFKKVKLKTKEPSGNDGNSEKAAER